MVSVSFGQGRFTNSKITQMKHKQTQMKLKMPQITLKWWFMLTKVSTFTLAGTLTSISLKIAVTRSKRQIGHASALRWDCSQPLRISVRERKYEQSARKRKSKRSAREARGGTWEWGLPARIISNTILRSRPILLRSHPLSVCSTIE